jgi:hypothetical protein
MPDRSNVASGRGNTKPKKKASGGKPKSAAPKGGYDWGDGKGRVHSIPKAQHQRNVTAQRNYGLGPDTPLDAPLTAQQAWGMAQASAGQVYDPQIQQARQMQTNAPVWYQNYINESKAAQAAAQTYAQPIVDTAKTAVTNAGATAPGLDPSSPQYAKEQQAAQGRQAITQLGANTLEAIPAALNAYLAGQQSIAARELPQVQAGYGQQIGQLQGQRAGAVNEAYGQIRQGEQNASLARSTLGLNTAKAEADAAYDAASLGQKASENRRDRRDKAAEVNQYGVPNSDWRKMSTAERQKVIKEFKAGGGTSAADKEAAKKKAAEKKRVQGIRKASGGFQSKVRDAQTAWERYARVKNPATDANGNVIPGKFIKATPDQIKQKLREEKYTETEIHVMLMLRGGKKLTPSEIDQIKQQNPDIRIPREWLQSNRRKAPRKPAPPNNAPSGYGRDDSFGGT